MSVLPTNARLTRVDAIASVDPSGAVTFTTGDVIDVECVIDEPTSSQRFVLGAVIEGVSAVIYVAVADLPDAVSISEGFAVQACQVVDDFDLESIVYRVVKRQLRAFDEVTHYELFVE